MHDSREGGSLQGRIPSTRLEPSANSLSLQLSTQQHDTQQKEKHLGEHPSQSRLTNRGDDPRASGNNDSGLERHCELRNTVGALSAVAKATNSRFAEVHMVGEVAAGHGFNVRGGLFCELKFVAGRMFGRQELLGEAAWPSTGDPEKTQLVTRTSGRVLLRLDVATRYFDVHGISNGSVGISSGLAAAEQEARLSQHLLECKQIFTAYLKAAECDNKHPPVP